MQSIPQIHSDIDRIRILLNHTFIYSITLVKHRTLYYEIIKLSSFFMIFSLYSFSLINKLFKKLFGKKIENRSAVQSLIYYFGSEAGPGFAFVEDDTVGGSDCHV